MNSFDFDLVVIGGGSGGVRAARIAANLGAKVALCEDKRLGGTCVNLGCVPKKLLMYGSQYSQHVEDASGYGWDISSATLNWSRLLENKDREISRLNGVYERLLNKSGVRLFSCRGKLLGPNQVRIGEETFSSKYIVLATGGRPFIPDIPGSELGITSDGVFSLKKLPSRVVIVGAGYIALEFASIFCDFGSEVHLVHRRNQILGTHFDPDIRSFLMDELSKKGIHFHLESQLERIQKNSNEELNIYLSGDEEIQTDQLIWATGRIPNVHQLGLEHAGVLLGAKSEIRVNQSFQTNCPSIYACGDVIGRVALTPVALAEGMVIARNLFLSPGHKVDYSNIPTAVFTHPNVGTVGLTEDEAKRKGHDITIFRSSFRSMKHSLSNRDIRTMMKLIVDTSSDRVLGCHMVGEEAGEIIQGLAVALKAGATKAVFDSTIGIHPTSAEEFVTMRTPLKD